MSRKPVIDRIGERPTDAIMFCVWMVQVAVCFVMLSPWYIPEISSPALNEAFSRNSTLNVYAIVLGVSGAIGLLCMWKPRWRYADTLKKYLTFWSFLIFTFFTMLRLIAFGPWNIVWLSYFLLALTMGIVHLRQKWEDR